MFHPGDLQSCQYNTHTPPNSNASRKTQKQSQKQQQSKLMDEIILDMIQENGAGDILSEADIPVVIKHVKDQIEKSQK
jgi:hypothetical protein